MTGLQLPPFRIIHAAYVTHDVERGKRRLASLFGVTEFIEYEGIEVEVPGGVARINFVLANSHGTNLEVIQPAGKMDQVYRQALPGDPDDIAFHHFASSVKSAEEWELVMAAGKQHGLDMPVMSSDHASPRYAYVDARPCLGHMLEFIWGDLPSPE